VEEHEEREGERKNEKAEEEKEAEKVSRDSEEHVDVGGESWVRSDQQRQLRVGADDGGGGNNLMHVVVYFGEQ